MKKTVPEGTYIMPADSTQAIGEGNLDQMGKAAPVDVNVSNGEYQMPPEQVQAIGAQVLDQMKDQTHTPTGLPHLQEQPGKKPELFFADGGLVRKEDEWKNNLKTGSQPQGSMGIGQARTGFNPNQATNTPALTAQKNIQFPTSQPKASAPAAAPAQPKSQPVQPKTQEQPSGFGIKNTAKTFLAPEHDNGAWNPIGGAVNTATGIGKGVIGGLGALAAGAGEGIRSTAAFVSGSENPNRGNMVAPSAEFSGQGFDQARLGMRQMFGLAPAAGASSAVGTAQAANTIDNPFQKAQGQQAQQKQQAVNRQQNTTATAAPSFDDQVNASLYGSALPGGQPQQAADPYAIKRNGNSFSYANPGAAAQARAAGTPELQSGGGFGLGKANDPRGVSNLMTNTKEIGLGASPVQDAIQQFQNLQGQGLGLRYPERPQMTDEQSNERRQLMSDIRAPIKGARGLTANQRGQMLELNQGDQNRAVQMYNTDANNATSVQNNAANNASSILQTGMREDGQNQRHGASLDLDSQQFNANYGLKAREQAMTEKKEGFGIRQAERMEKLHEMYDTAKTDEQRQSIMQRINRLSGNKDQNGRDRYITVGGGQVYDPQAGLINQPQRLFDTQTQQYVDVSQGSAQSNQAAAVELKEGAVYRDKETGKTVVIRNGEAVEVT
ncbi:hypothetical protein [Acinetobacter thermotolerans]|uniref:hypothetical protein n=1 Tax=Acinetobacter thermotolerans TaxID=3151487 RepID=UPI00325A48FC